MALGFQIDPALALTNDTASGRSGALPVLNAILLGQAKSAASGGGLLQGRSADENEVQVYGPDFVIPRFTPRDWMTLLEQSTRLNQSIRSLARAALGLGVKAGIPRRRLERLYGRRNLSLQARQSIDDLELFIEKPNRKLEPLPEVLFKAGVDYLGSGTAYLEVVEQDRQAGARVVSLLHAKTVGMRVHQDGSKYVRVLQNTLRPNRVYFRALGDEDPAHTFIDRLSGQLHRTWPKSKPESQRGTAVLQVKNYCPLDDFYGWPTSVPASKAIMANTYEGIWGINLLRNGASVPTIILVRNANLTPESQEQIEAFMQTGAKGVENVGRILLLQPDLNRLTPGQTPDIEIQSVKLAVNDGSGFLALRAANEAEIQEAVGAVSLLAAGSGLTRATAQVLKQIQFEQVVEPLTCQFEAILNMTVVPKIVRGDARLIFQRQVLLDPGQRASAIGRLSKVFTPAELRPVAAEVLQLVLGERDPEGADIMLAILERAAKEIIAKRDEAEVDSGNGGPRQLAVEDLLRNGVDDSDP